MTKIEKFINCLTSEDIDLIDKLINLCDGCQISEYVFNLANERENFVDIEDYIKEILQNEVGNSDLSKKYVDSVISETRSLYVQELIDDKYDFASGLYNCDDLYLFAIADVLDLDMSELKTDNN